MKNTDKISRGKGMKIALMSENDYGTIGYMQIEVFPTNIGMDLDIQSSLDSKAIEYYIQVLQRAQEALRENESQNQEGTKDD